MRLSSLQQAQHTAGVLVGLGEHGLGGLGEDVGLRVFRHLFRHVGVADGGFGGLDVLGGRREVAARVREAAHEGADGRGLIERLAESAIKDGQRALCVGARLDAEEVARITAQAEGVGVDVGEGREDVLVRFRADLEAEARVRESGFG